MSIFFRFSKNSRDPTLGNFFGVESRGPPASSPNPAHGPDQTPACRTSQVFNTHVFFSTAHGAAGTAPKVSVVSNELSNGAKGPDRTRNCRLHTLSGFRCQLWNAESAHVISGKHFEQLVVKLSTQNAELRILETHVEFQLTIDISRKSVVHGSMGHILVLASTKKIK